MRVNLKNIERMVEIMKTEMKEMIYGMRMHGEILYHEEDENGEYGIAVVSYGSHPCVYLKWPGLDTARDEGSILVHTDGEIHGGWTFCGDRDKLGLDGIWAGYDYMHWDDYVYVSNGKSIFDDSKRWTTEEMVENARIIMEDIKAGKFEID